MLDFFKKLFGQKQEEATEDNSAVSEEASFEAPAEESSEESSESSEESESSEGEKKEEAAF